MDCTFDEYMNDVRCQLACNASIDYQRNNVTYVYTNEQVEANLRYFEKCHKSGLSAYKSLLFFREYLDENR